ncbi:MAG: hypothetical protein Ct9H300mP1_13740 [Planctomycetaceae bacterium]|nr:MAG: hypothetical protein Ct9H300mP1_13740 [Planctomycetaceae bacterium]
MAVGRTKRCHRRVEVIGWKSKKLLAAKVFQVPGCRASGCSTQIVFKPATLADGLVISAIVRTGKKGGKGTSGSMRGIVPNCRLAPICLPPRGAACRVEEVIVISFHSLASEKSSTSPIAKLPKRDPKRFRCLVVFGLFTHILNLDDAVAGWKHRGGDTPVEFTWANCPPNGVETFPGTYQELFQFDLLVFSDVNYRAMGDVAMEMVGLCRARRQPAFCGRAVRFRNGEFQGARFLDVLPVRLRGPFDLKWAGKGENPGKLISDQPQHPLLREPGFDQSPRVFWHHFVTPKPNARVVLKAGSEPTLILGRYGKGARWPPDAEPPGAGRQRGGGLVGLGWLVSAGSKSVWLVERGGSAMRCSGSSLCRWSSSLMACLLPALFPTLLPAVEVRNSSFREARGTTLSAEEVAAMRKRGWKCPDAKDWPHSWGGQGSKVTLEFPLTRGARERRVLSVVCHQFRLRQRLLGEGLQALTDPDILGEREGDPASGPDGLQVVRRSQTDPAGRSNARVGSRDQ